MKIIQTMFIFSIISSLGFFVGNSGVEAIAQGQTADNLLANDHCISCHKENEILPEDFKEYDVHLQPGLSCAGCHGGDPTAEDMDEAMDPAKGFVGVPDRDQIPEFCGKCHSHIDIMRKYMPRIETDQVRQYFTSVHGKRLRTGDKKVAECASCHTAHGIAGVKDGRSTVYALNVPGTCNKCHGDAEYMKEYKIPTNQYEEYSKSVHGVDLLQNNDIGAPACNDCHGNHGATPPGVESVAHVCGNCHVSNMEYFESSPMAPAYAKLEIHACEQCHGYHGVMKTNDNMVGTSEKAVCVNCHSDGDKGYQAAGKIHEDISTLVSDYDTAETMLKDVQQKGMDDVDILFILKDARQDLITSRTLVHTFQPAKVKEKTDEGLKKTGEAIDLSKKEIRDYHTRRRGFGIATIFITVLVIALFFKIRDMGKK